MPLKKIWYAMAIGIILWAGIVIFIYSDSDSNVKVISLNSMFALFLLFFAIQCGSFFFVYLNEIVRYSINQFFKLNFNNAAVIYFSIIGVLIALVSAPDRSSGLFLLLNCAVVSALGALHAICSPKLSSLENTNSLRLVAYIIRGFVILVPIVFLLRLIGYGGAFFIVNEFVFSVIAYFGWKFLIEERVI